MKITKIHFYNQLMIFVRYNILNMKFSIKSTSTLFFIIFNCFFQTIFGTAIEEPDRIPHYHLRHNATNENPLNELLEEINSDDTANQMNSNLPEGIINLLTGCEIRPNGIIGTARENKVYFVRKISESDKVNHSHLVIKQQSPNSDCENNDLNAIFKIFRDKEVKLGLSSNNFSLAMPECTFTITDTDNNSMHYTIYHRVKGMSAHEIFCKLPSSRNDLANKLGQALFRLHESTRLNKKELESIVSITDEVNISRYYGDSEELSFSVATAQLLEISDLLVRKVLVRCMGDLHTKNVLQLISNDSVRFVDYTTLARDTIGKNKCSLFTNDISYFMYCCIYFYGEDFISTVGIDFLGNFSAAYFRSIHPQYHEKMLNLVKAGFIFFIEELAGYIVQNDIPANLQDLNIPTEQHERNEYIKKVKTLLKSIFFREHGITDNSSNDEILDLINKYSDTRKFIKSDFIDGILNKTKQILEQTSWETIQQEALRKVIRRKNTKLAIANQIVAKV